MMIRVVSHFFNRDECLYKENSLVARGDGHHARVKVEYI